jgi:iron complex outermembrane receptor protein
MKKMNLSMNIKRITITTASLVLAVVFNANAVSEMARDEVASDEMALDNVKITASGQLLNDVAQPIRVLGKEELQEQNGDTIGELLSSLPGISNASFGAGVGRPVIRGLSGNRVKMTINGTDSADVSAMSSDHAPMVDAANADQIEVIYGPNTLRFGSGAMGGVINMADSRFHEIPLDGFEGRVQSSVSSADSGTNVNASIDAGNGNWVMHLDGFSRTSDDFRAGNGETISNTSTDSQGVNAGLNYIQQNGNAHGVALSMLDYEYGVPNEDDEKAIVEPTQVRFDAQSIVYSLPPAFEQLKTQFTYIDYEHGEGTDGTVVGLFDKTSSEFKTTLSLANMSGWQSDVGLQISEQDLEVCHDHGGCPEIPNYSDLSWDREQGGNLSNTVIDGFMFSHDTPMPITHTQDVGVFLIMERDWAFGLLELGARYDQRAIEADPVSILPSYRQASDYYNDKTFNSVSLSAALTWRLDKQKFGISASRSQRAPVADELYWNGDHHATFSFQLDNPDLNIETAYSLDLTWTYEELDYQLQGTAYYYDFDGYIYNDLKSMADPFHGNPVYRNEQEDAWFVGTEWQFDYHVNDNLQWFLQADFVQARLKEGANKNLPRTPPVTTSSGIKWQANNWKVTTDVKYYAEQTAVADNESTTADYSVVNFYAAYTQPLSKSSMQLYLKAHNLMDEFGRNHVSYLKEYSPVIGRNVTLGLTYSF